MKYSDYVKLKLQNFSRNELTNFSISQINFGNTTGYLKRIAKNPSEQNSQDKPKTQEPPKKQEQPKKTESTKPQVATKTSESPKTQSNPQQSDTNKTLSDISKNAVSGLDKQLSSSSKSGSFDEKAVMAEQTKKVAQPSQNNQQNQQQTQAPQQNNKTETKKAETSPSTPQSQSPTKDNKVESTRTVKNWNGDDVEFEKRGGKWYRKGTQEEVGKTGKWRSYFDEKNGVKDVRPNNKSANGTNTGTNTNTSTSNKTKTAGNKQAKGKSNVDVKNATLDPKLVEAAKNMKGKDQSDVDAEVKRFVSGQVEQLSKMLNSKMISQAEYNDRLKLTTERAKLYKAELEKNLK